MLDYLIPAALMIAAFAAACAATLASVGGLQMARRLPVGLLHYYFYVLFFSNALATFLSSRNYAAVAGEAFSTDLSSSPISSWVIRLTSLFAMFASLDQVVRYFGRNKEVVGPRLLLGLSFIFFWVSNIIIPAIFSAHPVDLQLNWFYSLVLGVGMIFMLNESANMSILVCRNAIFIFCAVSLLLIPVRPDLVMDIGYTQGYIPGLPRFPGLAPHAIVMGMIASVGLWCLLAYPMKTPRWNRVSFFIGFAALFLAQSKTVWTSFLVGLPILFYYQDRMPSWRSMNASKHRLAFFTLGSLVLVCIAALTVYILFGNLGARLDRFLSSDQGAQITTFTGRLQIWEVALDEWERSPLFGYGLGLFGPDHRLQIGMSFATSGHNQFIDTLGRTGTVGTVATVIYLLCLFGFGIRFARPSRGLSLALTVSIFVRTITEVPIGLANIGPDTIPYYLLLAIIAANFGNKSVKGSARYA